MSAVHIRLQEKSDELTVPRKRCLPRNFGSLCCSLKSSADAPTGFPDDYDLWVDSREYVFG
jgi:hypothetical protein